MSEYMSIFQSKVHTLSKDQIHYPPINCDFSELIEEDRKQKIQLSTYYLGGKSVKGLQFLLPRFFWNTFKLFWLYWFFFNILAKMMEGQQQMLWFASVMVECISLLSFMKLKKVIEKSTAKNCFFFLIKFILFWTETGYL